MSGHRVLVVLLPLLAGGCAYNIASERMFYPVAWPPLRQSDTHDCNAFIGVYGAVGENAQSSPYGVNNPTLLSVLGLPGKPGVVYMSVTTASGGNYKIEALDSERQSIAIAGIPELISCRDGNLVRSFTRAGYADGSSHKAEFVTTLSLTSNGSIVAHVTGNLQSNDLLFHSTQSYDVLFKFARSE